MSGRPAVLDDDRRPLELLDILPAADDGGFRGNHSRLVVIERIVEGGRRRIIFHGNEGWCRTDILVLIIELSLAFFCTLPSNT